MNCEWCSDPLIQKTKHTHKKFCSHNCRKRKWGAVSYLKKIRASLDGIIQMVEKGYIRKNGIGNIETIIGIRPDEFTGELPVESQDSGSSA